MFFFVFCVAHLPSHESAGHTNMICAYRVEKSNIVHYPLQILNCITYKIKMCFYLTCSPCAGSVKGIELCVVDHTQKQCKLLLYFYIIITTIKHKFIIKAVYNLCLCVFVSARKYQNIITHTVRTLTIYKK